MTDDITIRRAETISDYRACQDAQRRAWGLTNEADVVPVATMVGAQRHGGLVLGAFDPVGEAVGVSFAFLGRIEGRLGLYSQLTGVVPGYQGQEIGHRLKQAQWAHARAEGLELVAWAFDPLQAGNAHFNFAKLGVRSRRYIENMYGLRTDALNPDVPTDRLIVEWPTVPESRVEVGDEEVEHLPRVVEAVTRPDGMPEVAAIRTEVAAGLDRVLVEVPAEIGRLRDQAPDLAERWRAAVCEGLTSLFASGFEAVGFVRRKITGTPRGFYVLQRAER